MNIYMSKYTRDYTKKYAEQNAKDREERKNQAELGTADIQEIIGKVYRSMHGYGSNAQTLAQARKYNGKIRLKDVVKWKDDNLQRKIKLKGMSSFIANKAKQEYQMDLMFLSDLNYKQDDYTYVGGLLAVDIFTKRCEVVLMKGKTTQDVLNALKEIIPKMGGKPESIYTDREGGMISKEVQNYLEQEGIKFISTSNHAAYAERTIRTIKDMLHKREEDNPDTKWYDLMPTVLETYNHKNPSNITQMTPDKASQPENHLDVKLQLEMHRRHSRIYPDIKVGEKVRVYRKKKVGEKEDVSQWSNAVHTVESIEHWHGQNFYKVSGKAHPYVRADILRLGPENTLQEKPYRIPQHREKKEEEEEEPEEPRFKEGGSSSSAPAAAPAAEPASASEPAPPAKPTMSATSELLRRSIPNYVKKTAEEKAANLAAARARKQEMAEITARLLEQRRQQAQAK